MYNERIDEVLSNGKVTKAELIELLEEIRDAEVEDLEDDDKVEGTPLPEFKTPCGEVHRGFQWHLNEHVRNCKRCWEAGSLVTDVVELPQAVQS